MRVRNTSLRLFRRRLAATPSTTFASFRFALQKVDIFCPNVLASGQVRRARCLPKTGRLDGGWKPHPQPLAHLLLEARPLAPVAPPWNALSCWTAPVLGPVLWTPPLPLHCCFAVNTPCTVSCSPVALITSWHIKSHPLSYLARILKRYCFVKTKKED